MKVRVVELKNALTPTLSRKAGEGDGTLYGCSLHCLLVLFVTALIPLRIFAAESRSLTVVSYPARPPKLPLWLARDAGVF